MLDKLVEESIESAIGLTEAGAVLERGFFPEIIATMLEIVVQAICRSRSGSRASTNRDRIQCYKCREYISFHKGQSHF